MELRRSPRLPVLRPIMCYGKNLTVGIVSNLSRGGCKVESSTPVNTGTYLELRIYLTQDLKLPMKVDTATVRWSHEGEFGLEFLIARPEEEERLHRFVTALGAGRSH